MIRATAIVRRPAVKAERVADTITLDHEARQRRRLTLTADGGLAFLLDLAGGGALEDGDALKLEDGRLVRVAAAPQRLLRITTDNPLRLMKVGWHLGNRHVAAEITADALFIEDDHVLVEMVRGLGATAEIVERAFRPERGAYAGEGHGHSHGHSHGHGHSHDGEHGHHHDHADHHAHAHAESHAHGHAHAQSHSHAGAAAATIIMPTPTRTRVRPIGTEPPPGQAATRLAWWLSPAFPVGAYAYSHALEWAAEAGDLGNEREAAAWIGDVVCDGAGRNDAILLRHAHAALARGDRTALAEINDLALALAPSGELRLETAQQGRSFIDAVLAAWPEPRLAEAAQALDDIAYPAAVGAAAAAHGIAAEAAVPLYLSAFAHNLVSAAMRLAPIGQNAALRILARLEERLAASASEVTRATLDGIGGMTVRADLGSFRHETQYTRLFRS